MTAPTATAHRRSEAIARFSVRRISRLGRTEMVLFWRNRMAVFTALLLPVTTITALSQIESVGAGSLPARQ
ncbi:MAG TPA: hypothetical protein VF755_03525 [Catenuloplanes sp.]|jgi:hypothetical protein